MISCYHTLESDHNPVTLAKQVPPFTPPPVIVNDVLRLSEPKPKQIKELVIVNDVLRLSELKPKQIKE